MEVRSRGRGRLVLWSVVGVVILAGAAGGLLYARNAGGAAAEAKKDAEKKDEPAASPVELTEVRRGGISTYLTGTTSLECRNTAVIVARRMGQVLSMAAEEGALVGQGAVLARLDDTEARLAVERAELNAETARREAERGEQLHKQGFLSEKELDDLRLKTRSAGVELEQARYDLAQTRITAPFPGQVTDRMINLGETVTEGRECFRVVDVDPILARVYFPERDLSRVRIGQEATLSLDGHPGEEFPARVSLVNPAVDGTNGTFKVTLEVPNPDRRLRPGAFARVKLRTGSFDEVVLLPRRGVLTEDGDDYVFVAQGDSAVKVPVTVGAIEGETAQILSGLENGALVVTVGQGGLKTGSRIKAVSF
jgi:membrane fusion protein (multidrug efflux system)